MGHIHVTSQDVSSENHVVEVKCKPEYAELADELSRYATIYNDNLRELIPVDEFVTPDIEMHNKLRECANLC